MMGLRLAFFSVFFEQRTKDGKIIIIILYRWKTIVGLLAATAQRSSAAIQQLHCMEVSWYRWELLASGKSFGSLYNKTFFPFNKSTGVFKIVDPAGLAKLWGIQKNHLSMNYDKMSRALRYYYRVNILRKVQGERHCYQWVLNFIRWLEVKY